MAKLCPQCEKENPNSANVCMFCGTRFVENAESDKMDALHSELSEAKDMIRLLKKALADAQQNTGSSTENLQTIDNLQKQLDILQEKEERKDIVTQKPVIPPPLTPPPSPSLSTPSVPPPPPPPPKSPVVKFIIALAAVVLLIILIVNYSQKDKNALSEAPAQEQAQEASITENYEIISPAPEEENTSYYDKGVVINGVKWATRNVAALGTFADNPEDAGRFYQWNRDESWSATGYVSGWDSSYPSGDYWSKANDPSPAGWRVPTLYEFEKLLDTYYVDNERTLQSGVYGRRFTDKNTGNTLFLPYAGFRSRNGEVSHISDIGYYWSSTRNNANSAFNLFFGIDNANDCGYRNSFRSHGFSVRAVAE